mmetsp:Transcript_50716/g.94772  ORF Transcript_50716/g.94772 Transcript_50716/m.94772 type:complete len:222 (+) Transcript_50716:73-738(+)
MTAATMRHSRAMGAGRLGGTPTRRGPTRRGPTRRGTRTGVLRPATSARNVATTARRVGTRPMDSIIAPRAGISGMLCPCHHQSQACKDLSASRFPRSVHLAFVTLAAHAVHSGMPHLRSGMLTKGHSWMRKACRSSVACATVTPTAIWTYYSTTCGTEVRSGATRRRYARTGSLGSASMRRTVLSRTGKRSWNLGRCSNGSMWSPFWFSSNDMRNSPASRP